MPEHISKEMLERYLKKDLGVHDLLVTDEHLAECDTCLEKVKSARQIEAVSIEGLTAAEFRSAQAHLSFEQIESYVDGKADAADREIVEFHIEVCGECERELAGIEEMRRLIGEDVDRRAASTEESKPARSPSWIAGITFPRLAFAGALVAVMAAVIFFAFRQSPPLDVATNPAPTPVNSPESGPPPANDETGGPEFTEDGPAGKSNIGTTKPESEYASLPASARAEVEKAVASGSLSIPAKVKELRISQGKLMGPGSEGVPFTLSKPLGKIVRSARPDFSWSALQGAESYVVEVFDERFNLVARSPSVSGSAWKADKPLPGGKTLIWQVTASKGGEGIRSPERPAPYARFMVLDSKTSAELDRLARAARNSHLALGILYANAGLMDDAEKEFQNELRKNPGSARARKFLAQVRAAR